MVEKWAMSPGGSYTTYYGSPPDPERRVWFEDARRVMDRAEALVELGYRPLITCSEDRVGWVLTW